jgi:tetratricopeptide (TPR) repeat protein
MLKVDPEWPSILELMRWCDETSHTQELFGFTLMLVHYMDSRFHNNDRLYFVRRSVEIAQASGRGYDEALLRIDALGWTYAEESRFDDAMSEIRKGIAIAETLEDGADLLTLAWAWLARVEAEQEHWTSAQDAIQRAGGRETPPWIVCRVLMARGDIELKMGEGGKALNSYQAAARASASYGDEGRGYQTKPRIGLAYLATGDYPQAEQVFQELTRFGDMVIAELYGEYGLAMIAHQKGEAKGAGALVQDVRERLLRRTSSNLLLNMTQRLQLELASRRSAGI